MARLLIELGADPTVSGVDRVMHQREYVPLAIAARFGDIEMIELLLSSAPADAYNVSTVKEIRQLVEYRDGNELRAEIIFLIEAWCD